MRKISLTASAADAGERLDKFLAARSGLSRGACRRAITEGGVWLGGKRVLRLSRPVEEGERYALVVDAKPPETPEPRLIHEDRWLLALDKPAGLPTQGTLASASANALGWAERHVGSPVFSVHRLDAGTSGVLAVAKRRDAATALGQSFREGAVQKRYLAIASGQLPGEQGILDAPLAPSPTPGRWQVARAGRGIPAVTEYRVLARAGSLLFLALEPRTGRTHQIRVHLAHAGAPILGDSRYRGPAVAALPSGGAFTARRPMLHAERLTVPHPEDGRAVTYEAALAEDMKELVGALGWKVGGL